MLLKMAPGINVGNRRHFAMHRILILALSVAVLFPTCFAYRVKFDVSIPSGDASFIMNVVPQWAPIGAARFKELVE